MDEKTLWKTTLDQLELELSTPIFQTFFKNTKITKMEESMMEIACANQAAKERIETRHYSQLKNIIDGLTKKEVSLNFVVDNTLKPTNDLGPLFQSGKYEEPIKTSAHKDSGLYPQYTFDNFVVGANNNLAHVVALSIAENPGKVYNPLFLYAGVGLGKTHLIQAIGNQILKTQPSKRVIYCTGETFTNELLESIYKAKQFRDATTSFRKKFRETDVLIIDDIQFIAGRETTQEEFYHTFNALYPAGKQIILASDRPPKEIDKLEERLVSRFSSGMIADMQAPDVDMRNAILRKKREQLRSNISDEIIDFIAQISPSNIRDLEGKFLQVIALTQTSKEDATLEKISQFFGKNKSKEPERVSSKTIFNAVTKYFEITATDLKDKSRKREVVVPRQIAMYLMRSLTDVPLVQIGELLGGRDHTTAIHGNDKIEKEVVTNQKIQEDVKNIKNLLNLQTA